MIVDTPSIALALSGAAIAVVSLYLLWMRTREAPTARRVPLLLLRAALLALVLLAVLNPRVEREHRFSDPSLLLVAVDTSRSMTDLPLEGESRYAQALAVLSDGALARNLRGHEVETYLLSDSARRVNAAPAELEGAPHTDLRRALGELLRLPRVREPVACLLISDGADGSGSTAVGVAQALGGYGVPIHCVGVGSPEPVPDLSIPGLVAPRTVTEGESFDLRALVRTAGLADVPVDLSVALSDRTLASKRLEPGATQRPARFTLTAGSPGYQRYTATVSSSAREATLANNSRSVLVRVEPAEARLLLIEGTARREYAFLRRLLLRIEDLDTTILLRKRDPDGFWFDHEEPRRAGISEIRELSRYRAVILSNVEAAALGGAFVSRLSEYVAGGGTVAMLGGPASFGAGGWAGTPVAEALPVRIGPGDALLSDPISMQLTGSGDLSASLRETGVQAWGRLPLLEGMNAVSGVGAAAETAIVGVSGGATLGPVVVAGRHGAGRSLAVTVDDTWRWRQSPSADEHSRAAWEAFWTTVIGWLIVPRADRQVVLEFGRETWESGEAVRAEVHVTDAEMTPVEGALVVLTVIGPDGERTIEAEPSSDPGIYRAIWRAGDPAALNVIATARLGGTKLGEDRRSIEVIEPVGELTRAARPDVLEAIAAETGGEYRPADQADALAQILSPEPEQAVRTMRLQPARTVPFFLIVVIVAGADWLLRRRWSIG